MKIQESLYKKFFSPENQSHTKLFLACLSSMVVMTILFFSTQNKGKTQASFNDSSINLSVMIPEGYVLFSFEADNYEQIEPLLESYNMVKVYSLKGGLLAQNIKMLRAPKDPSRLSFLVPVNIANYFALFGLEYRIMLQKYDGSKKPQITNKNSKRPNITITYGGVKNE